MAGGFPGFPPEALRFLSQLRRNNNREWFLAHKNIYEQKVKGPMVELVQALGGAIQAFAPEMVVDPKRAIYRIHRDTRFSPDKTPYKTHIAALFTPRGIPKHAGAALYLHIAPEEVLIGGGVYMPGTEELRAIRRHIADHSEELRRILKRRDFKKWFGGLEGDQLVRAPKDFPPDHPAVDLLRYKQFLVSVVEPGKFAESPKLFSRVLVLFASMAPFVRFLNAPLQPRGPRITDDF
jgi:uncharacterized protein (TIGR02453 family)